MSELTIIELAKQVSSIIWHSCLLWMALSFIRNLFEWLRYRETRRGPAFRIAFLVMLQNAVRDGKIEAITQVLNIVAKADGFRSFDAMVDDLTQGSDYQVNDG